MKNETFDSLVILPETRAFKKNFGLQLENVIFISINRINKINNVLLSLI